MRYNIRPSARGNDRRDGRSLAELLAAGSVRRDPDPTPPHGIQRPDLTGINVKDDNDFVTDDEETDPNPLDPWDPEDIEEERQLREERNKKGYL